MDRYTRLSTSWSRRVGSWLPVLGFSILFSLITGIVFGILPAWTVSQYHPLDALRGADRSGGDRSSVLQKPLAIAQVAFSIALLIAAGLVTQSLRNLEYQHFGFVTEGRLIVNIAPGLAGYTPDRLDGLYQRLAETLPQIPGVLSASLSWYSPLGGYNASEPVYIQGKQLNYGWTAPSWDRVGPRYFETIGTRLLRGRVIDERDTPGALNVAVIAYADGWAPSSCTSREDRRIWSRLSARRLRMSIRISPFSR